MTVTNGTVPLEHNHSKGAPQSDHKNFDHFSSSYSPLITNSQKTAIPSVNSSSTRDTFFVFLTLTFISITLYFTFFLWRKHRQRPVGTIYKLEEYRYSRLSQNELEVDSVVFYGDTLQQQQQDLSQNSEEEDVGCNNKPATLHVETDSLITVSNCKSTITSTLQQPKIKSPSIILQDSDEDLLQ